MATPHDNLFKHTFSDPAHAEGLLKSVLPPQLAQAIDWPSLRLCPGSFVDAELAEHHTDLLFRVQMGGREAIVYLLLEHKSWNDPLTSLHLLRYMVRIWDSLMRLEAPPHRLPVIIPVVVSHGPLAWKSAPDFFHLVDLDGFSPAVIESLRAFVPDFRFVLDDLTQARAGELEERSLSVIARLTLLSLQQLWPGAHVMAALRRLAASMRAVLRSPQGREALEVVMRYIIFVSRMPTLDIAHAIRESVGRKPRKS